MKRKQSRHGNEIAFAALNGITSTFDSDDIHLRTLEPVELERSPSYTVLRQSPSIIAMRVYTLTFIALASATRFPSAFAAIPHPVFLNALQQFSPLLSPKTLLSLQTALALSTAQPLLEGSIATPFRKALAAAQLAGSQLDASVLVDVETCFNAIQKAGGVPKGYVCVDSGKNTAFAYGVAFDTVLEQFVGIVPPATLTAIQDKTTPFFLSLGLIPPANDLWIQVNNVMASVVASLSGESVTGIERAQQCFKAAIEGAKPRTDRSCFTGPNSSLVSLNTLFAGVTQQFIGYLPPNAILDVINIYSYYFSKADVVPGLKLSKAISLSLNSIGASTSGNSVTFLAQLDQCFTSLIMSASPSTYTCVVGPKGPIMTLQVLINGIVSERCAPERKFSNLRSVAFKLQQGFGVLPPTVVLQLESALAPYLATEDPSSDAINKAFRATFKAASLGPSFTTCVEALEDCVDSALLSGTNGCSLLDHCKPLVDA
ncbi:hypothetical protein P7C70_g4302, partial [Phenoliferia sp. Uapishka_3]